MNRLRRALIRTCAWICVASAPLATYAQDFPSKPIRIIVPFTAGDLADTIARTIGQKMGEQLNTTVVVDNRPGASGMVGLQAALQQPADGYTFVMGQMGGMAVAPNINKQPFDVRREFVAVASMYSNYMLLVSSNAFGPKTLPEIIAYAKKNPGAVRIATNGEGGFPHLAIEQFKEAGGFEYTHVPYKGSSQIPADVIEGRVDLTILGFSTLMPHVREGRMRPIAVTGKTRPDTAATIPTFGESLQGYEALGWFGLFARQGTPQAVIDKVNATVNAALKMPDIVERAKVLGLDTVAGSPKEFQTMWQADYDKWGRLIANLKLEQK